MTKHMDGNVLFEVRERKALFFEQSAAVLPAFLL